jgi:hypothetical protein
MDDMRTLVVKLGTDGFAVKRWRPSPDGQFELVMEAGEREAQHRELATSDPNANKYDLAIFAAEWDARMAQCIATLDDAKAALQAWEQAWEQAQLAPFFSEREAAEYETTVAKLRALVCKCDEMKERGPRQAHWFVPPSGESAMRISYAIATE